MTKNNKSQGKLKMMRKWQRTQKEVVRMQHSTNTSKLLINKVDDGQMEKNVSNAQNNLIAGNVVQSHLRRIDKPSTTHENQNQESFTATSCWSPLLHLLIRKK